MDPRRHEVFQDISSEMTIILEESITKARDLGNTEVTPLHVIDRIIDSHSIGIVCRDCLPCQVLKNCISRAINCIPVNVIRPAHPVISNDLVMAINNLRGGQVSDMEDAKQLFVYMLDDPTVQTAIEKVPGFYISFFKNNMENRGTVCMCM